MQAHRHRRGRPVLLRRDFGRVTKCPHAFQIVEAADFGTEQMHDDIFGINQHPVRRWQTFDAGMTSGLFDTLGKLLRHRGHLARRTARCDDHMVGNIAFAFKRDGDHFLRLIIIERLKNQRVQRVGVNVGSLAFAVALPEAGTDAGSIKMAP